MKSYAYNMQGKKAIAVDPCPICGSKFTHVFRKLRVRNVAANR